MYRPARVWTEALLNWRSGVLCILFVQGGVRPLRRRGANAPLFTGSNELSAIVTCSTMLEWHQQEIHKARCTLSIFKGIKGTFYDSYSIALKRIDVILSKNCRSKVVVVIQVIGLGYWTQFWEHFIYAYISEDNLFITVTFT